MNNTYKTNKTDWRRLVRSILFVALLLGVALPAQARDYVITWTNGGTTYYVGMNGNNIAVKTEFDITCVWTCRNGNNDANLGGTSYSLRNKNNNTYFLTTSCSRAGNWEGYNYVYTYTWNALTVQNSASNIWRSSNATNGNVYAYYSTGTGYGSWNRSASIRVVNNAWAMYDNNTNGSQNSQVTTTTPGASSPTTAEIGTLTITPITAELYQGENEAFTASASVTVTNYSVPAHTKYTFTVGSTDYEYFYYNNTRYTSIDDFSTKTTTTQTPSYAWTKTGDDGSNASLSSTNAASTTVTHATQAAADKSVTLTVTASYSGAESKTANATVVLYGPMVAPTITRSGNSISIATTNINATIYYTTNGSTPTASSTPYTGSFDLTTSPTTVKAIAIRDGHSSTVTTETFNMQLPMPVISLTGAVATVTAGTGSPDGTKLYYTTNGTTPTSSSTEITSGNTVTLTNPQTIKVIAIKSGYDNSDIASAEYIVEGISGSLVILDDRENHSWAYYSDPDCPVRSLNPADVKITYYGDGIMMTGDDDYTASSTDTIHPSNTDYVGGAKVNVTSGETQNTFVYYKTLERTDGSTSANPTGRCLYTTIPNPFQVRPTYGSRGKTDANDFTGWRGFQCWRLKSVTGGAVYSAASGGTALAVGAIINGETQIYFAPTSEYGMAVELEAVWARAYLIKGNQGGANTILSQNVGVERNFMTLTTNENYRFNGTDGRRITNVGYPVTISCYYPSGEAPDNTGGVVTGNNSNITLGANTKFENVTLNVGGNYISANGYDLIIGRGCTVTAANVYGATSAPSSSFDFRIESGTFTASRIFNSTGNISSAITVNATFGCDYDRAKNDNSKLTLSSYFEVGTGSRCASSSSKINVRALSGTFGSNSADVELYIGFASPGGVSYATRELEVLGGNFLGGIAGGIEANTTGIQASTLMATMRIKGGTIHQYLYGSGQYSAGYGGRKTVITGGTFDCWVAGGCYGTGHRDDRKGITNGNVQIYFGGNANQTSTDGIYGAGYGNYDYTATYYTVNQSNVVFADEATTAGSVYGGGNNGYATDDIKVYLAGGHVAGNVFGGANKAPSSQDVAVVVTGGSVDGGVYGGSNQSGVISGQITVDVYGTDPQPGSGYAIHQVFGGGNVAAYTGTPVVTVHNDSSCNISIGELYGGGNAATVTGTNVTVSGGNRIGNVFGGCYGANVTTNGTKVTIKGGTIEKVFGGNNAGGSITGAIKVRVHKDSDCPMKIGELYGGGNVAGSAAGSIDIGCTGTYVEDAGGHADCNETDNRIGYELEGIGDVYGGANEANISTGITLTIDSGMVYRVFGGNNSDGNISGTITVNIQQTNPNNCGWYVGYVYGGGFNADYSNAATNNPAVNVSAGLVSHNVYGGGKGSGAVVTGNPTVTLSGTARGGGNVDGGGDAAAVTGNTSVKLQN